MKKSDYAMIILIATLGVVTAYLLAINLSFLRPPQDGVKVQTMEQISTEVAEPSEKIFNKDAINPTVEVVVGGDNDQRQ